MGFDPPPRRVSNLTLPHSPNDAIRQMGHQVSLDAMLILSLIDAANTTQVYQLGSLQLQPEGAQAFVKLETKVAFHVEIE